MFEFTTQLPQKFEEIQELYKIRGPRYDQEPLNKLYMLCEEICSSKQFSGIILEKETNKVIAAGSPELVKVDTPLEPGTYTKAVYSEDGTVVRMYNYEGIWYLATNKCMDARFSKWDKNNGNFSDLFYSIWNETDNELLEPGYTYTFVICHSLNRIVVQHQLNKLVFISKINNETGELCVDNPFKYVHNTRVKSENDNVKSIRGLIYTGNNGKFFQYDFPEYTELANIRGNVPNIGIRYLQLIRTPELLNKLKEHYPEHFFLFAVTQHQLDKLVFDLYDLYYTTHIRGDTRITEVHPFFKSVQAVHWYYHNKNASKLESEPREAVTEDDVKSVVYNFSTSVITKLFRWTNVGNVHEI